MKFKINFNINFVWDDVLNIYDKKNIKGLKHYENQNRRIRKF